MLLLAEYFKFRKDFGWRCQITCRTTRFPALFNASTETACETLTTDMSLTLVMISLTLSRLSFDAAPPGMSFVM